MEIIKKFNEYAIFCEKMIVTLQSCTDEKSTFFTLFRISYYFIYCFK